MNQSLRFDSPIYNLQVFLRTISDRYPSIPLVVPDGIYGNKTHNAVKEYQRIFSLKEDGITDFGTWNHILKTYDGIVEEKRHGNSVLIYPETGLSENSKSFKPTVMIMQVMINALAEFFENISLSSVSGYIDAATVKSIKSIQIISGMNPDGNITKKFWNNLSLLYEGLIPFDRSEFLNEECLRNAK